MDFCKSFIDTYNFIYEHRLGSAFVTAAAIGSLPKPGEPWTVYEVIYTFLNALAVNLPTRFRREEHAK